MTSQKERLYAIHPIPSTPLYVNPIITIEYQMSFSSMGNIATIINELVVCHNARQNAISVSY